MTGLSLDTLRAWERRYQVVKPARSSRGRLYKDGDVQRFLRLRQLVSQGYAIGAIAALSEARLQKLLDVPAATEPGHAARDADLASVIAAVEAFDGARLNNELGRLATLLSPAEFVHQVALPLMRTVGERWHAETLHASQEHLATESVRNLLGAMVRLNRPDETQPRLLATTPAGELHELGVLAAAVLAGARGFQLLCLGPNLPASDILFAVERYAPRIVLMGIATPEPLAVSVETVRDVAAGLPAGTELWAGGAGARTALKGTTRPGIFCLEDLQEMERLLADRRGKMPT